MNTAAAPHPVVVPTVGAELPRLSHLLAAAFATDPVSDWLFDGEQDARHPAFFRAFLELAGRAGRVEQTFDGTGVAVWIDNTGTHDIAAWEHFEARLRDAVAGHERRWEALDTAMRAAHPTGPHWWLAFIGVLPGHGRRGRGGELLRHAATWVGDREAYLEATSRRLVAFYRRHGYRAVGQIAVAQGPRLYPMCRPGDGRP